MGISPFRKLADAIQGGKADGKPSSEYPADQIRKGIKVEMEHTDDPKKAEEISRDHLEEFPNYYTALSKMEKQLEQQKEKRANGDEEEVATPGKKIPREVLIRFFKENPNPDDDQIHDLAESHGTDPHTVETQIYGILTDLMGRNKTAAVLDDLIKIGSRRNVRYHSRDSFIRAINKIASSVGDDEDQIMKGEQKPEAPELLQPDEGPGSGFRSEMESSTAAVESEHTKNREGDYLPSAFSQFGAAARQTRKDLNSVLDNFSSEAVASKALTNKAQEKLSSADLAAIFRT